MGIYLSGGNDSFVRGALKTQYSRTLGPCMNLGRHPPHRRPWTSDGTGLMNALLQA